MARPEQMARPASIVTLAMIAGLFVFCPLAATAAEQKTETRRVSKFEARQIRESCRERALEGRLHGPDRTAFLSKCYFGRVSHPSVRRECLKAAAAKGLDKAATQEFLHSCVKEKRRQRELAPL